MLSRNLPLRVAAEGLYVQVLVQTDLARVGQFLAIRKEQELARGLYLEVVVEECVDFLHGAGIDLRVIVGLHQLEILEAIRVRLLQENVVLHVVELHYLDLRPQAEALRVRNFEHGRGGAVPEHRIEMINVNYSLKIMGLGASHSQEGSRSGHASTALLVAQIKVLLLVVIFYVLFEPHYAQSRAQAVFKVRSHQYQLIVQNSYLRIPSLHLFLHIVDYVVSISLPEHHQVLLRLFPICGNAGALLEFHDHIGLVVVEVYHSSVVAFLLIILGVVDHRLFKLVGLKFGFVFKRKILYEQTDVLAFVDEGDVGILHSYRCDQGARIERSPKQAHVLIKKLVASVPV